jgi:hypothetical protein
MRIDAKFFSGEAHLHQASGGLADLMRTLYIAEAKRCLVTANVAAITDSGGGAAANGTIDVITIPPPFTEVGTASAQKAEFEAACGNVKDAITELGAKLVALNNVVPAIDFVDNSGGAGADGTIAAIDATMTAVAASIARNAGVVTVATGIRNAISTLCFVTNKMRAAVGLAAIVDNSGGQVLYPNTIPAISTDTGTASDGTNLTGTAATAANTFLAACAAAVKELSTAINAVRAVTAPTAVAHCAA